MGKISKIAILIFLVGLLVLIRFFEETLFYDPLLSFFKSGYANEPLPEFETWKILFNTAVRFWCNSLISLAILWVIFKDNSIIKLSALLYILLFILLFIVFYILLFSSETGNHMLLFYVRRFLIQPLLLLLLLPAFYFHRKTVH